MSVILVSLPQITYGRDVPHSHKVIDIFAGPGGLGEGFTSLRTARGEHPFEIVVSAEMDLAAHSTLSLRAVFRKCMAAGSREQKAYRELLDRVTGPSSSPLDDVVVPSHIRPLWKAVRGEALRITLGTTAGNSALRGRLLGIRKHRSTGLVLIGGPPCQAYSLVGRARNRGVSGYRPEDDKKHFLYREYLSILDEFRPDVFIMENVKGILSSNVAGTAMFEKILEDLRDPSGKGRNDYELLPLAAPRQRDLVGKQSDFVVRSELFGIPQARHRVIVLGIRRDTLASRIAAMNCLVPGSATVNLGEVISDLPRIRSGLSKSQDDGKAWLSVMFEQRDRLAKILRKRDPELAQYVSKRRFNRRLARSSNVYRKARPELPALAKQLRATGKETILGHETRGHMPLDLCRYLYCASYAAVYGRSPTSSAFPGELAPAHRSWNKGHFADRFRVQLPNAPASTVTSHLAKDGHHFIHWDPQQCRSLTVREAARIQTFPDDYAFLGNRTEQYTQVGNAVPPLLARQIAMVVAVLLA